MEVCLEVRHEEDRSSSMNALGAIINAVALRAKIYGGMRMTEAIINKHQFVNIVRNCGI